MGANRSEICVSALDTFIVENRIDFGHSFVDTRKYTWLHPTSDVWVYNSYFLNFYPTLRSVPASATFVEGGPGSLEKIGRVMFVPPGRVISSQSIQGTQASMTCVLSPEMIDGLLPKTPDWNKTNLLEGLHLTSPEVEWTLHKMYLELQRRGFAADIMVESLANTLCIALIRRFGLDREEVRRSIGGLSPWRMRLIRDRVQADGTPPGLGELADLCGMSVRHLCRAFKTETAQTIAKFVEKTMAERARVMLADSGATVAEVAQALGFSSATAFAYAFRRSTGLRPSEVEGRRRTTTGGSARNKH